MASLTGRIANFLSTRLPGLGAKGTARHVEQYRSSNGQKGAKFMGKPVFLLDVVGRKSGEPRPVMLMLARDGDDLIVVGSNGGNPYTPNWYKNLMAADTTEVQLGAERWSVSAHQVDDESERQRLWGIAAAAYPDFNSYAELTDRKIPVAVLKRVE